MPRTKPADKQGRRLKIIRAALRLTQAELAAKLSALMRRDVSEDNISSYERGIAEVPTDIAIAIQDQYDIGIGYIYNGQINQITDQNRRTTILEITASLRGEE